MTLIAFDGWNIVRRVHAANKTERAGERSRQAYRNSAATFGRAMRRFRPSYGVIAWDHPAPTWRHDIYPQYKADREPATAELLAGLADFQSELWERHGLISVSIAGVEADDVLATLAKTWSAKRTEPCVMVSTDKDLASLATDGVIVFDVFEDRIRDFEWCVGKFGVQPAQLLDLLALMGDSTDSVPGVAGIGKVKARSLMEDYGSLDAILAAAPNIEGSLGRYLVAGTDQARLSRGLIELKTDVTLGLTWSALRLQHSSKSSARTPALQ